jgi:hypothetical protein
MDMNSSLQKGQAARRADEQAGPHEIPGDYSIDETTIEEKISIATPRQLMWWKFRKHRVAVASVIVLAVLYLVGFIGAEFFSPYDPNAFSAAYKFVPPMGISFIDAEGNFSLNPGVFRVTSERDPNTLREIWTTDYRAFRCRLGWSAWFSAWCWASCWAVSPAITAAGSITSSSA